MSKQGKSRTALQRFERDLRARNLRPNTVRSYLRAVVGFLEFIQVAPSKARECDVRDYLVHLSGTHKASTVNQIGAALRCFYTETLRRPRIVARVRRVKHRRPLPTILSRGEVSRLLAATRSAKYRALILLMYGMGLRVGEACALQVGDIDSKRMVVRIEQCKGQPRMVPLPRTVLLALRVYWREARPTGPELFPGRGAARTVSRTAISQALKQIAAQAGIDKDLSPHGLRHSYATHMLDSGADLRTVQVLLGHASIVSTMAYSRLSRGQLTRVASPVEQLSTKAGKLRG